MSVFIRKLQEGGVTQPQTDTSSTDQNKDFKALGKYMFKVLKGQDGRDPEYVNAPD